MIFASPKHSAQSGTKSSKQEVLLLRAYKEDADGKNFVVCSRSVRCDSRPLEPGFSRGELLPSGYIIESSGDGTSKVTFLGQFSRDLFQLVQPHVLQTVEKFREILEQEAASSPAIERRDAWMELRKAQNTD